jgi:hypothetical protein
MTADRHRTEAEADEACSADRTIAALEQWVDEQHRDRRGEVSPERRSDHAGRVADRSQVQVSMAIDRNAQRQRADQVAPTRSMRGRESSLTLVTTTGRPAPPGRAARWSRTPR